MAKKIGTAIVSSVWVTIGSKQYIPEKNQYCEEQFSVTHPLTLKLKDTPYALLVFCLFNGCVYKFDRAGYSSEEMVLQIWDLEDKERRKFERIRGRQLPLGKDQKFKREVISEDVRITVWRRDGGKCTKCDSRDKLEFDHIIPVSRGGSSTTRNIELLCQLHNRQKSNKLQ